MVRVEAADEPSRLQFLRPMLLSALLGAVNMYWSGSLGAAMLLRPELTAGTPPTVTRCLLEYAPHVFCVRSSGSPRIDSRSNLQGEILQLWLVCVFRQTSNGHVFKFARRSAEYNRVSLSCTWQYHWGGV